MINLENLKYKFPDHIKCEVSNKNIFVLNSTHPSKKNTLKKKLLMLPESLHPPPVMSLFRKY